MSADLWTFATTLYAKPGVEAACLALQDAGADVCLVLCGLWLDQRGAAHSAEREVQLRQIAQGWQHEVIEPIRTLRRSWRAAAMGDAALATLRKRLQQLELDAEREQLQRLQAHSASWRGSAGTHLRRWLDALTPRGAITTQNASDRLHTARLAE
ncbi:TIGR02444 family protein [Phytopseudomonas punonensis]|uniref:TIGR02444 family protein n=1 Tax=Phytopseudomonas punonensis TaxID=1220495 RepID=A0A1M7HW12_9GAMM|nr:TIGR02444 family protein [Pseudomonas punonensis]SHM32696.1 TIGR02444 family protein [Pseudomonas punonensis]